MTMAGTIAIERDTEWRHIVESIDERIHKLTGLLKATAEQTIPLRTIFPDRPRWWNQRLDTLKREVYRKRRTYQNERDPDLRRELHQDYVNEKNTLNTAIRKRREDSWDAFLQDELWTNPWGLPYRLAASKNKQNLRFFETIRKKKPEGEDRPEEMTTALTETCNEVLNNFIGTGRC